MNQQFSIGLFISPFDWFRFGLHGFDNAWVFNLGPLGFHLDLGSK